MSWFNVWTGIKTKTCRYLLQRYLGQFLEERLNLEQLKVDLYNGKATVKNVSLNIDALNKLFESHGWSVEVISGHIGLLTVTVPWNALMSNSSYIEISDAVISVRPVQRQNNGTSMLESMWSSASSSMQLAEECMMQNDDENEENSEANNKSIPGLEKFAETIDNILNRIKASFTNTVLRLEYQSSDSSKTISLCFEINKLMYENETGCERHPKESYMEGRRNDNPNCRLPTSSNVDEQQGNIYLLPMFAKHNISISGLRLCTEEQKTSAGASRYISVDISKTGDIPILEINEHLNIRIKMKQSENINGPKVVINTEMGSVYTLITPRQIHLILKLMDAFQDDSCDIQAEENLEVIAFNDYKMYHKRDELVELGNWIDCEATPTNRDTLHHLRFDRIKVLPKGYSPPSSSVSSSSTVTGLSKLQRKTSSLEYSGEILNFSLKICSFVSIILIEDILVESSTNNQSPLNKTSEQNMTRFANTFFENLRRVVDKNMDSSKLTDGKNHLFIRVFPIISEGSQHRIKHMLLSKFNIIAQKLDLFEVLNGKSSELITFDRADGFNGADVSISIKSDISSKIIDIALQKCELEVDISIYDRLSAILGPSPFATFSSYNTRCYYSKQETQKLTLTTNLTSTSLEVKVRFPIFDARPIHDPNRVPWWQQNVRRDFLLISFNYVSIKIVSGVCELLSNELNVYYVEDNLEDKVWVLKTSSSSDQANALDYVKITVTIPDEHYWTKLKKSCLDKRMYGNSSRAHSDRLPFSAKRVCRESDTLHNKRDNTESETILLPGETEELKEFCSATMRTSKIQVQINVPNVEIVLGSKKFYEVIYNRFNCDLFMWEPSSPILNALHVDSTENKQSIYNISVTPAARLRNINDSYLSDFEESDSNGSHKINLKNISMAESIYFSIHDPIKSQELEHEEPDFQKSKCSVEIFIQKGSVGLFLPIRNKENLIIPEDVGKIDIKVNELKIFSVSGYNENRNLCYLCLEVGDVKMDHCGLIHEMYTKLFACGSTESDRYMRKTIYKTPEGLSKSNQPIMNERQMMSLVIETKRVTDQRIKRLRVTTSIQQATLRYNSMLSNQFWLHQLIDFLDVVDYPIEGYAPYGIITEMQLHLWNCAIDYRPSNFDYRALLELGAFTISSNVISSVNGCNLRFIIEEFILSIAPCKESTKHEKILIESRYLVPVLDIGLFDISLRLNENSSGKHPKFDLRCSVNDAHLRTCSDSGKALAQLIEHLAMDGDSLETDQNETGGTSQKSENYEIESSFLDEPNQSQQEWQQERVNLMMAEALQETVTISVSPSTSKNSGFTDHGIEPYYFPDEEQTNPSDLEYDEGNEISEILNFEHHVMSTSYSAAEPSTDVLPQVKSDLGDVNLEPRHNVYPRRPQEDEYCVISENERQLVSQCGVRDVKVCEDPLRIVDNHFCLPSNKIDLLKSPYDFPIPVSRYTLCEMTFTWHLYGGNDFISIPENMSATSEASHLRMSDAYKHGVSYSKADNSVHGANKPKDLSWKTIGGVQRNHGVIVEIQLTKVRLSYEIYPNYTAQASRQVLVINDIEIRDRLQSSEINKFLYHPSTRTTSHKSPQQMVVIKALHVRPNPKLSAAEECSLRISLLPMRLHIDQDTLIFLADYFTNMGNNMKEAHATDNPPPEAHAPVMDVGPSELENELQARKLISTNLELLENEVMNKSLAQMEAKEKHSPIYFREVLFSPDVPIRFDYHGHRVELSRGPIAGLLMGLGQLQCSEIRLKKIIHRRGFLGIEKLVTYLCKEWLKDIKRNQLPKILKGVGPTYSFVQFIQGVIDLFRLPIEQYQRDGRIIRGLQLGAQSFTARTALAALEITSRIIQLLQFTAETAFDMVSSGPSVGRVRKHRKDKKKRAQRPKDVREGVTNAYLIVKEGINDSAANLIETAVAEHDQKGYTGAVGAVMRQIPQLVVCPAVLATQATTNILGGVKSSLVPEAKVEAREKWKTDND